MFLHDTALTCTFTIKQFQLQTPTMTLIYVVHTVHICALTVFCIPLFTMCFISDFCLAELL